MKREDTQGKEEIPKGIFSDRINPSMCCHCRKLVRIKIEQKQDD
jgi:hypothetical protein